MKTKGLIRKGELAEELGIVKRQVDYLNREGLIEETKRMKGGQRLYNLEFAKRRYGLIKFLEKEGFSMRHIKILLKKRDRSFVGGEG